MYICLNRATAGASLPYEQFVTLAADTGFGGVDLDVGWAATHDAAALRDLVQSRRLRLGGWGLPFDWRGQETSHLDQGLKDLDRVAAIAAELGIDSCATWILPASERPFGLNWSFHVDRLRPAARVLREHGLRLGLEFVAPYHLRRQWPHEFIFTPGQMLELADEVGPNVGLLIDSFHCHASGTPWEEVAQLPGEKIVLVHLNDAPDRPLHERRDDHRLLPGEGILDLAGFIGALKSAGYAGPVSLEVFSEELKRLEPPVAARRAWAATAKSLQGVNIG